MGILITVLLSLDMLVALLMILVILMQRPKSEGLGAAFGGGVTENIFGAQTTNVLTKFTGWLAGFFFALTFLLSILYAQRSVGGSNLRRELLRTQAASSSPQQSAGPNSSATTTASAAPVASAKPSDLAAGAAGQPSPSPAVSATVPQSP